ncbi:MAG: MFS transporter [Candidatus Nomurabacteria bacterium]|nr:MFS transporter [Candidatus Nomurabacteria bacterium]
MNLTKINRMYILSFLFTLHIAISAYVNSTFLSNIVSEKWVGILYTLASLATLLLLSKSANILKYFGNKRLTLWLLLVNMFSLFGMIISNNPYIISAAFIAFVSTNTQILFCIDIFIEHFGDKSTVGKNRGLYLTVINLAWVTSPLITAFLITKEGGYQTIYTLAFAMTVIMTLGLIFSVKKFDDKSYQKTPFLETYRFLKTNPHMLAITTINFILQFFYSWMIVYTPIYLYQHIGLGWSQIGIIFTIMLSPFVIFGLPIGILVDKYHIRKRTLLYIGFIIISASTFLISTTTIKSVLVWSAILFMTRVGASIIETTSEIYFFTHVKEEETYLLSVFRDMTPVAYIIAPLISTLIFIYLPFKSLFIILSIILLAGLYYIPKLMHNHDYGIPNQNK